VSATLAAPRRSRRISSPNAGFGPELTPDWPREPAQWWIAAAESNVKAGKQIADPRGNNRRARLRAVAESTPKAGE